MFTYSLNNNSFRSYQTLLNVYTVSRYSECPTPPHHFISWRTLLPACHTLRGRNRPPM